MTDRHTGTHFQKFMDKITASTNVSKYVDIPMIAVFGDTASGKSSLLSNLSMVDLPSNHNLTTRCPILIQLLQDDTLQARITVQWKSDHPGCNGSNYDDNHPEFPEFPERIATKDTWHQIPLFIREAQEHILKHTGKDVAPDIVSLQISQPDIGLAGGSQQHPLTLLDLPGMVRSRGNDEAESLVPDVTKLVEEYLQNPRCVILAVVPANVDFHNSQIMAQAQQVDPDTKRTIPVITKPDLIDQGAEAEVLDLLQGKKILFKLGFHMIKGRGQAMLDREESIVDGLQDEISFLEQTEPWKSIEDRTLFGTEHLRRKLGELQLSMIQSTVPTILSEIQEKQHHAQTQLAQMGSQTHLTVSDRRRYYQDICQTFVTQLKSSLSGKGRALQKPSAAAQLHEACAEFMDHIRAGSLGTIKSVVEGARVLVTSAKGDVRGEVVHVDETFACVDYVDETDEKLLDVLFDYRGYKAQQDLEEDDVWSDGNKVYIARKNNTFDALRKIPIHLIRTDPSWLTTKIADNRSDDLACFLNVDIFKNIVEGFVEEDWTPHCTKLLGSTKEILLTTLKECIRAKWSGSVDRYPPLRLFLEKECRSVAEDLIREARKQVHKHLDVERHPYTLDKTLFDNIAEARNRGLKRELETALKVDQEGVFDTQAIKTIIDTVFERNQQKRMDEHMAEEMEIVLEAYGQVATKRVVDRTPMICWEVFRSLPSSVEESLWSVTDNTLSNCMEEAPDFTRTYRAFSNELSEMTKALEIFESIL